ncbi:DoxX family protein [Segetibacter sp. 3557_3]|uniref:DoxX family protein n=1 Tax=Segetibacter sp. 3557_3 TaxID=2547429 RepID=UPI0010587DA9|nr:DoxX family protein [Segetibacter sp. 3557_3]TDH28723.1 DoxX family protein [Segetibacter sp. 3557_3]
MKTTKTEKIIYWTTTILIFVMEGVMPALTSHTELAKEGIRHLGYPEYFGKALVVFKVLGAIVLIMPKVPNRIKEWAYAGFAFDFIFAGISHWAVDGFGGQTFFPLFFLAILITSYIFYFRLNRYQNNSKLTFKANDYVVSSIHQ